MHDCIVQSDTATLSGFVVTLCPFFFFFEFNSPPLYLQVQFSGVIYRSHHGLIMTERATVHVTCVVRYMDYSKWWYLSVSGPDHFYSSVRSRNFSGRPSQPADGRIDENEHNPHDVAKNTGLSCLGIISLRVASAHGDPMPQDDGRFDRKKGDTEKGTFIEREPLFDGG